MDIESLVWKIIFVTLMVVCLGLASIGVIIWFVALDTPLFLKCIVSVLCLFLGLTFFMLWLLCFLDTRKEKSMRLIDADIADVVIIYDKSNELIPASEVREYIKRQKAFLDKFPTIDAVPVVRCRECKHHYWEQEPCHGKSIHYCNLPHMRGVEVFKEFFCYYGERKEGVDNG